MLLHHAIISLPLIVASFACTAVEDEGVGATRVQEPARSTSRMADEKVDTGNSPVQIAQYPSAPFEDSEGNLWFRTTVKGLIRYDGTEFVTFTTADGLASNMIRGVLEDGDGLLWIATGGGLCTYDGESFTTLTDYGDLTVTYGFTKEGNHRDVWEVIMDRHGKVWIATMDGVFRYDGTSFSPFPLPVSGAKGSFEFGPKMVYFIYEDKEGVLWFATDGAGAVSYDGTSMVVYTAKDNGLCSDRVCNILQDGQGNYWFGTSDGGVSRYDGESFTTFLRNNTFSESMGWGRVMGLLEDSAGDMWFGVAGIGRGAYRYDGERFQFYSKKDGLGGGHIASIREDRSGNLWFGCTGGVYRYDGESFVNFTKSD
ncbi:MAG: ligand-binding sensor domain-containing protein [Planctomycetota bacterium]|jgi:ligand-binding sensor domain-containing protein